MTNASIQTRRRAFKNLLGFLAASPVVRAQRDMADPVERGLALEEVVNVFEFEPLCRRNISKASYDYIAGGVDAEFTLRRNREAFDRFIFRPRILVNTAQMDLSTSILGEKIGMPILVAPMAAHQLAHPDAEFGTAKATAAAKTILCLSSNSSLPMEKVAESTTGPKWWQLYARENLDSTRERVERAVAAGFKAICFTVDAPYNSHRERLLRNRVRSQVPVGGAANPPRRRRPDEPERAPHPYRLEAVLVNELDWTFVAKLKDWAKVPVLVKGILTAEDGALAVKHGADGIVVSNHGGRYLDYAPSTIEVLPEVVEAVGGKIPIVIDSGFRRGTDVLKALALGANAVMVGRPMLWGLGAFGESGARRVLELLQTELALAMGLAGKPTIKSIDKTLIRIDR